MSGPHWCWGFGLRIQSDLPVPGAQPAARGAADVQILLGAAALTQVQRELPPYALGHDGSLLFSLPGVADYLCQRGKTITVAPCMGADPEEVSGMLIATALPALLWMRGELLLHAAGALLPGQSAAVAFAAPSGAGKSTRLRELLAEGASAVGDDVLCIRTLGGSMRVSGLPAMTQVRLADGRRLYAAVRPEQQQPEAELGCILVEAPPGQHGRLSGAEAVGAVLRSLHRSRVARLLGLEPANLRQVAQLVRSVPVFAGHLGSGTDLMDGRRETAVS